MGSFAAAAFAVASVVFHIYLIFTGLLPNLITRPIHLALALPWVFVFGPKAEGLKKWVGYALCCIGMLGCLYIISHRDQLGDQYGSIEGTGQLVMALGLILVILEMARRAIKLALPTVAVIALAYGFLGQYIPGEFGHSGIPVDSFLGTLVVAEGGIWGQLTGVSVNVVAVFVILGAFVGVGEGGDAFMALATKLAGRYRAGAAKVSVISSAFFGSISGSASANVASTGSITIPAMKRLGYPPQFAAAVEAVASSGGQIMPPLMGAGAFIMAELLRVNYSDIMAIAVLPALLFFYATWTGVDVFARRYNLLAMGKEDIPELRQVIRLAPFFCLPFCTLLGILFLTDYTPQFASGVAIFVSAALLCTTINYDFIYLRVFPRLLKACITAAQQIAVIASIIICAGLIIGVLNMTGLGVKITSIILSFSNGNLWVALILTALSCLILGMEVPTTAAYVICISVAGPALSELGLPDMYAHLFVFWFALLSTITPPVCGTVFIAAGMADTPWIPVAGHAMKLGLGLYLVPMAFVANPALLQITDHPLMSMAALFKIAFGLWLLSQGIIGGRFPKWTQLPFLGMGGVAIFGFGIGTW
ncbi:MAG: TRAP transporter fused permease subunit [Pseudomonadota bacterium]